MSDKPPFDPSKPYEPAKKPPFDPSKPYNVVATSPTTPPDIGLLEAISSGVDQGVSLHHGDEIKAAMQSKNEQQYEDTVRAIRQRIAQAREQHPVAYPIAELIGGAVPYTLGTAAAGPAGLATVGAIDAAGRYEPTRKEYKQPSTGVLPMAQHAAMGVAASVAGQKLGEGVGNKVGELARSKAATEAGAVLNGIPDQNAGKELLDHGFARGFRDRSLSSEEAKIVNQLANIAKPYGDEIQGLYHEAMDALRQDAQDAGSNAAEAAVSVKRFLMRLPKDARVKAYTLVQRFHKAKDLEQFVKDVPDVPKDPSGGWWDTIKAVGAGAAGITGHFTGIDPTLAAGATYVGIPAARKGFSAMGSPAVMSSVSKLIPGMGKYTPMLQRELETRGEHALSVMDYVMQEKDPEYRQQREEAQKATMERGDD